MRWSFKYSQLCLTLNSVLLLNWRTYLTVLFNIFILYHKYSWELLLTKTLCDGCHNDRDQSSTLDISHYKYVYEVMRGNRPRTHKISPGKIWTCLWVSVLCNSDILSFPLKWSKAPRRVGFLYLSRKIPTYPSPEPTLTLTSHLGQNVGLGEG